MIPYPLELFQSTLSLRRATRFRPSVPCFWIFQSTLSLRRATALIDRFAKKDLFQSTLSLRRATMNPWSAGSTIGFQSTLSLRRATIPPNRERGGDHIFQSTLSLRRATRRRNDRRGSHLISIHALLAESDDSARLASLSNSEFQSTLSLRRATRPIDRAGTPAIFQSTLSLRRATFLAASFRAFISISIHALLAESDLGIGLKLVQGCLFQSTLSLRRATSYAPREGVWPLFQSTLSLRRATRSNGEAEFHHHISIHALLAESDRASHSLPHAQ